MVPQGPLPPPQAFGPEVLPPPAGPAAAGRSPLVVDVIVRGNVNEEQARRYIRTRKEFEFETATVNADVRRLITSNLYQDVRTYTRDVAEGVVVIFELVGRPKINYIEFLGNRGFSDNKLLKTCELKKGVPLNAFDVEEGRRKIEELYRGRGYPHAQISILEGNKPGDQGAVYVVSEGYLQRIASVTFEGNTFASDGVLNTKIESKPGYLWYFIRGKFSREKLDSDVAKLTAYYHDFGYFRARVGREVRFDEEGRWATIRFIIDEGERYSVRNVLITGNEKFHTDPILAALKLQPNQPFSNGAMQKDLNLLRDLYGSQGHIFAQIDANPRFIDEPGKIDLVYKVQEGEPFRVGEVNVHIAGEFPHTRRNVVLNRLSLRPGDVIDIRQIRESERRLKFSQLFETEQDGGEPPRIVVRPPELAGASLAQNGVRGQDPAAADPSPFAEPSASAAAAPLPTYDLDVFVRFHDQPPAAAPASSPRTISSAASSVPAWPMGRVLQPLPPVTPE
jgi:outer membrane protein insertion porin family